MLFLKSRLSLPKWNSDVSIVENNLANLDREPIYEKEVFSNDKSETKIIGLG